jgi:DNA-binding response OmpR family regulator
MTAPATDAPLDGVDWIAIVHSPHATTTVASRLTDLPCRVSAVPLDHTMAESIGGSTPAVVVVDHTTDDFNIARVVREIAQLTRAPIVVVATGAESADDRWLTERLDDGAYMVIPATAAQPVLLAQVRAVLRIAPPAPPGPELLVVGDVTIDVGAHRLLVADREVSCGPVLFSLLLVLAGSPNRVLPRETLLRRVWGVSPTSANLRRVRIAASQLRRVLGVGPRRPRIETVARVGYCLAVDG